MPPVCLVILDGWGLAPDGPGNAISLASTPVFDDLWETYEHTQLTAMGESVGLPAGQMGNSEVGHLNLGAGAIVKQDLAAHRRGGRGGPARRERRHPGGARGRRARPPPRARVRRRGALRRPPPQGADRARGRARRARPRRPRLHGRPRHVPDERRRHARHRRGLDGRRRRGTHRLGRRALLRHGPRQALGPHPEGLRPPRARARRAPRRHGRGRRPRRLRPRRDRRVHHRDHGRRRGHDPARRLRAHLQLPPGPDAADHARARRAGVHGGRPRRRGAGRALRDAHRVRGDLVVRGRLPARAPGDDARQAAGRRREDPAPRRRDGEVPARHLLLQRRRGDPVRRRGPRARALPARRADLRPQAGDERPRGRGRARAPLARGRSRRSRSSTSPTPTWSATPA